MNKGSARTLFIGLALSFLALPPAAGAAGNDKGNGGDGIVLDSGEILLYDFFERQIDPAALLGSLDPDARRPWNHMLETMTYRIDIDRRHIYRGGSLWNGAQEGEVRRGLTVVLHRVGQYHPGLAKAILEELAALRWVQAPVDLRPNPDTASALDLEGIRVIGCARTTRGVVLYSPSCAGSGMSAGHKVGLILHEAIYSLYKKAYPDAPTSFDVRSLIAALFDTSVDEYGELSRLLAA